MVGMFFIKIFLKYNLKYTLLPLLNHNKSLYQHNNMYISTVS